MNDTIWDTGVIEATAGPIAWPGMTRSDAERLEPSPTADGISDRAYRVTGVLIDGLPFVAEVFVPERGKAGPAKVRLWLDADYSRRHFGEEYPVRQQMDLYKQLFQKHLGSGESEHWRTWGRLTIAEDPWTRDPTIAFWYKY